MFRIVIDISLWSGYSLGRVKRIYEEIIRDHGGQYRQMLFLMGPRQAGKTTSSLAAAKEHRSHHYFTWDNRDHRKLIAAGPTALADSISLTAHSQAKPFVIFGEIHKFSEWKDFLKGFYDTYPDQATILVTGSAHMDVYRRGSDSLMGRYLTFRFHPLSVGELIDQTLPEAELRAQPRQLPDKKWNQLLQFGGYPDPFIKADKRFALRWKRLRLEQLIHSDLRDLTNVRDLTQMEILAEILLNHAGQLVTYESLSRKIGVSSHTIKRWLEMLRRIYFCFQIKPWTKNVSRSLLKEPKYYPWDWTLCKDDGAMAEAFIAAHLLKSVHFWTDSGLGDYDLHFIRDKQKREVDFLVSRNGEPWFLVEVKNGNRSGISKNLYHFHQELGADHAFQVSLEAPYVDRSCFEAKMPIIVSARTFLSQLI